MKPYQKIKIKRVVDGDTVILDDYKKTRVRLYGIDTPETYPKKQEYGQIATDFLDLLLKANSNKELLMETKSKDVYGRKVAIIYIVDTEGVKHDTGLILLDSGLAWAYKKYLKGSVEETAYLNAEKEAQNSKLHIWSNENPMNPSDFRKLGK